METDLKTAATEHAMAQANDAFFDRKISEALSRRGTSQRVPIPGGRMVEPPRRHLNRTHPNPKRSDMLSNAVSFIKDLKPGYHYIWPRRADVHTQAYIDAGIYDPVRYDAINKKNVLAAVSPSADGAETLWMSHILVGISPANWDEFFVAYEDEAVDRLVDHRSEMEEKIYEASRGAARFAMSRQEHPAGMVTDLSPPPGEL